MLVVPFIKAVKNLSVLGSYRLIGVCVIKSRSMVAFGSPDVWTVSSCLLSWALSKKLVDCPRS